MTERFETKERLHQYLMDNKKELIYRKKSEPKYGDSVFRSPEIARNNTGAAAKELPAGGVESMSKIHARLVINTTNIVDSHRDCHLPGIWDKSIRESKNILLLQDHSRALNDIIAERVKAAAEMFEWKDLGFPEWSGKTQALVFDAVIEKERNDFMFKYYTKGYYVEHSVGMMYVNLELAVNNESSEYREEKKVWDMYIDSIVNKDYAKEKGYFWAVHEAEIVEGSAVAMGSNYVTPALLIEEVKSQEYNERPEGARKSMFSRLDINCLKK
jgi:hypothetical protein